MLVLAAGRAWAGSGRVAFDGTKIAANAAMERQPRTKTGYAGWPKQWLDAAAAVDAAEDALLGRRARGDEPAPESA